MTAFVFVDTNVLVYARDPRDQIKQAKARDWIRLLWEEQRGRTSIQVLSEFHEVVTRKLRGLVAQDEVWDEVQSYLQWDPQPIDKNVLVRAYEITRRYKLNWWDCLVIAAASEQNCVLLLSEDMQDGAEYNGVVVRSPFSLAVAEEHGAYAPVMKLPSRHRGRGRPRRVAAA